MSNTVVSIFIRVACTTYLSRLLLSSSCVPSSTSAQAFLFTHHFTLLPPRSSLSSSTYHNRNYPYNSNRYTIRSRYVVSSQQDDGDEATTDPRKEDSSSFLRRNKSWIIVVDDEEPIRLALGDYLYGSGYSVTACADAEAVLELLAAVPIDGEEGEKGRDNGNGGGEPSFHGGRLPDAIVSDIRMPGLGMSGLELLSRLKHPSRHLASSNSDYTDKFYNNNYNANTNKSLQLRQRLERYRRIPVVLLSAKAMTKDRIQGYRLGADAYVMKPFDPEELLSILDKLIRRRIEMERGGWTVKEGVVGVGGNGWDEEKKGARLENIGDDGSAIDSQKNDVRTTNGIPEVDIDTITKPPSPITDSSFAKKPPPPHPKTTPSLLTPTEHQVLSLLSQGYTNKEIAAARGKTANGAAGVAKTVGRLYEKTLTKTRTELLRWAIRNGYVPPPTT